MPPVHQALDIICETCLVLAHGTYHLLREGSIMNKQMITYSFSKGSETNIQDDVIKKNKTVVV